jgi:hypothetical protein
MYKNAMGPGQCCPYNLKRNPSQPIIHNNVVSHFSINDSVDKTFSTPRLIV